MAISGNTNITVAFKKLAMSVQNISVLVVYSTDVINKPTNIFAPWG